MARRVTRARVGRITARLVEEFAQRWGEQTARALPPAVRTHARASIREGLLAMATVWEQTLRGIEVRARYLRRDLERGRPAPERKARRPRKRR
jgi:hypothetical protein